LYCTRILILAFIFLQHIKLCDCRRALIMALLYRNYIITWMVTIVTVATSYALFPRELLYIYNLPCCKRARFEFFKVTLTVAKYDHNNSVYNIIYSRDNLGLDTFQSRGVNRNAKQIIIIISSCFSQCLQNIRIVQSFALS